MIFPLIVLYGIFDFLLGSKAELARLDKLFKKAKSVDRRAEIREQQEYIFNQGLQALRRHEHELPQSVRKYFLNNGPKPTMEQVSQELQKMNYSDSKFNKRTIKGVVVATIVIFTLIALFL